MNYWELLRSKLDYIVDSHVHLRKDEPPDIALGELRLHGIDAVVVLGLPNSKRVLENIDINDVRREYERTLPFIRKYSATLDFFEPEALYYTSLKLVEAYVERPCMFCKYKKVNDVKVYKFYAVDLSAPPTKIVEGIEDAVARGASGLKVISTLYLKTLDDEAVRVVLEAAKSLDLPVIVHAGCDPGIWELPGYCKYGDPSRLEKLLREYRDVRVVIAHVGGYSAMAPGVFFEETIALLRSYPHVYADISALPPHLVAAVLRAAPRNKLLFGTDYPVVEVDMDVYLNELARLILELGLPRRELETLFNGNARDVLGVEP